MGSFKFQKTGHIFCVKFGNSIVTNGKGFFYKYLWSECFKYPVERSIGFKTYPYFSSLFFYINYSFTDDGFLRWLLN